ncbi:MAG: hypothetical protein LBJ09_03245 [Clostridiales bacterium]|nr:hypothetical protein [Clostridiales bacterium]
MNKEIINSMRVLQEKRKAVEAAAAILRADEERLKAYIGRFDEEEQKIFNSIDNFGSAIKFFDFYKLLSQERKSYQEYIDKLVDDINVCLEKREALLKEIEKTKDKSEKKSLEKILQLLDNDLVGLRKKLSETKESLDKLTPILVCSEEQKDKYEQGRAIYAEDIKNFTNILRELGSEDIVKLEIDKTYFKNSLFSLFKKTLTNEFELGSNSRDSLEDVIKGTIKICFEDLSLDHTEENEKMFKEFGESFLHLWNQFFPEGEEVLHNSLDFDKSQQLNDEVFYIESDFKNGKDGDLKDDFDNEILKRTKIVHFNRNCLVSGIFADMDVSMSERTYYFLTDNVRGYRDLLSDRRHSLLLKFKKSDLFLENFNDPFDPNPCIEALKATEGLKFEEVKFEEGELSKVGSYCATGFGVAGVGAGTAALILFILGGPLALPAIILLGSTIGLGGASFASSIAQTSVNKDFKEQKEVDRVAYDAKFYLGQGSPAVTDMPSSSTVEPKPPQVDAKI